MSFRRRVQTQCFLLQTLLRLALSVAIALPILAPLQGSNLLESARGDERLLSHGATLFAAVWANGVDQLERQAYVIASVLIAAWLCKIVVDALVFGALLRQKTPFSEENTRSSLELVLPFALLSLGLVTGTAALLGGYVLMLPAIGTILEPTLGDRVTDLTELTLFGLFGLAALGLMLVTELTRTHLALNHTSLRPSLRAARRVLRQRTGAVLLQAAPRWLAALTLHTLALYWHFRWQQNSHLALAPLPAVVVVELAAAATTWLYLDWVLASKRLYRSPDANDGALVYGD